MKETEELTRDLNLQIIENTKLRAKIRQLEDTVKQLRENLSAVNQELLISRETETAAGQKKKGRPATIDEATRQRIRKLKENGLTVREISKKEGVSIGTISSIINGIY